MAHAEKCPICNGNGVLAEGPAYLYPTAPTCHGCGGCGWVSVQDAPLFPETHEERFIDPSLAEYYKRKYGDPPMIVLTPWFPGESGTTSVPFETRTNAPDSWTLMDANAR
jgi:hypothetical protein